LKLEPTAREGGEWVMQIAQGYNWLEDYPKLKTTYARALEAFTTSYCGLVTSQAPCHCSRRVVRAVELGRVSRGHDAPQLEAAHVQMESLHSAAALMRSHPAYRAPGAVLEGVRNLLGREGQ
jgi:hypothetical protein